MNEIERKIDEADIILLLISADFFETECYTLIHEKWQALIESVIPVILRPYHWQELIVGNLKALPKNDEPVSRWTSSDDAYCDIANGIKEVINELQNRIVFPAYHYSYPMNSTKQEAYCHRVL